MGAYPYDDSYEAKYVLGFYFSKGCKQVVLIEKLKPAWQAGKLNGVGGKIEETDQTSYTAMVREFKEETGIDTVIDDWDHYASYAGKDWRMDIFCAFGDVTQAKTMEKEKVVVVDTFNLPENVMRNLRFLIPLALQEDLHPVHFNEDDSGLSQGYMTINFPIESDRKNIMQFETKRIEEKRLKRRIKMGLS